MSGIIYLVQPCELVGTNRYKIGMSSKTTLDRVIKGYRKGTRYLNIQEVEYPLELEKKIKNKFNNKFSLIAGKEYFEGDEYDIRNSFVRMVNDEHILRNRYCCRYIYNLAKLSVICVTCYFSLNYFM
jgi:hypothetical protein